MNIDFNSLFDAGSRAAATAKEKAKEAAKEGKRQVDLANAKGKLAKAERRLGALVYSLHINGEENAALVDQYIQAIADVEAEIEALNAGEAAEPAEAAEAEAAEETEEDVVVDAPAEETPAEPKTTVCPECGSEVEEGALFCPHCGAKR